MISSWLADTVLFASLVLSVGAYVFVSKREASFINILTPSFIISIPAYYLLPLFFAHVFGNDASPYAYIYVYSTLAVENICFAYAYTRPSRGLIRLPLRYSYNNFALLSFVFLGLSVLTYIPILLQFPEYILDPRQIYAHTRTGFGVNFYISSTLAYFAVILIQFSQKSRWVKGFVVLTATAMLSLHGSKGQVLFLALLLALYQIYVKKHKLKFLPALAVSVGLGVLMLLLFAAAMTLGDSASDALEAVSQYSDYTRNAMMLIDSHFPLQYGRLTFEAQTVARVPRVLMPGKPKNFGGLYLDDQFYPDAIDQDQGAPDFGIGVQYADFGIFAIAYLALFAMLRGWLARVFVNRLSYSGHPADFFLVAFLAGISLFPVGAVGWMLPEALIAAFCLRFASTLGASKVYRERVTTRPVLIPPMMPQPGRARNA
jgi:O-antigen polymerase